MKKSYLAAAAILGAAVFAGQAHAVKIDLGKTKFKMGFRAKIHAYYDGIQTKKDQSDLSIDVPFARIYAKGSSGKILKWGFQVDFKSPEGGKTAEVIDAFGILDFAKEFKILAGYIKVPFERHAGINSGWSWIAPTGTTHKLMGANTGLFSNPFHGDEKADASGSRSPQIGVWGNVAGGLFKYYLTLVDGTDANGDTIKRQTGYAARVQFTPTMAGFKGEKGYVLKDTYLGKKDVLTIGVSYTAQSKYDDANSGGKDDDFNALGVDLMWEQNFGAFVPNLSAGYISKTVTYGEGGDKKSQGFTVQGQLLFNTKTLLGKPAIGFRYTQVDPDTSKDKDTRSVLGIIGQLYIKGVGNRLAISVDSYKDEKKSDPDKQSWTDVTLALWYNF